MSFRRRLSRWSLALAAVCLGACVLPEATRTSAAGAGGTGSGGSAGSAGAAGGCDPPHSVEFVGAGALACYTDRDEVEPVDGPTHLLESVDGLVPGHLVVVPQRTAAEGFWYGPARGAFFFRLIQGDFIAEARLHVVDVNGDPPPNGNNNGGGLLVRRPPSGSGGGAPGEDWLLADLSNDGQGVYKVQMFGTVNDVTLNTPASQPNLQPGDYVTVRLCRVGSALQSWYEDAGVWVQLLAPLVPSLAGEVQLGFAAHLPSPGNARVEFEYLRIDIDPQLSCNASTIAWD